MVEHLPEDASSRGYTLVPRPVPLPRSRFTSDCGPEVFCAILGYWGKAVEVHEISPLVRDAEARGTLPSRLVPLARHRGFKVSLVEGSISRLRKAVDRGVPPLIMLESGGGDFHFFVVVGYSDPENQIVCEEYGGAKRLISYERVEALWEKAGRVMMEIEPTTAEADFHAGADRESKGLYEEALFYYRRALGADPDHFGALAGTGNCLLALGKPQEALGPYQRARELDPDDPKLLNNLAHLYLVLGRDAGEAEKMADRAAARLEEEFRKAQEELDRTTSPVRRSALQRALSWKERDWAHALGTLGQARAAAGKPVLAIAAWKASYDHLPLTEADARARRLHEIGLAYRALGMPLEARQHLERARMEARDPALRAKIDESLGP